MRDPQFNQSQSGVSPGESGFDSLGVPPQLPPTPPLPWQVPPPPPAPSAPPQNNRTLWIVLGGIGCLGFVLVAACVGLVFSLTFITESEQGEFVAPVPDAMTVVSEPIAPQPLTEDPAQQTLLQDALTSSVTSSMLVREDEESRFAFDDGRYLIEVNKLDWMAWALVEGTYDDTVAIQVTTSIANNPDDTAAGIIFHYQDEENFYLYNVSGNGFYRLSLLENNEWIILIDWTPSDVIAIAGAGETAPTNTLRVELVGERIALFVNNVKVEETIDSTFSRGEVALTANVFEQVGGQVYFSDLLITSTTRN